MSDKQVLDSYVEPTNDWIERVQALAAERGHDMRCGDMLAIAMYAVAVYVGHTEEDAQLAEANRAVRRELAKQGEVDQANAGEPYERAYMRAFAFIDSLFEVFPNGLDPHDVVRMVFNVILSRGGTIPGADELAEIRELAVNDTATYELHQSFGQIVSDLEFDPKTGKLL